MHSGYVQPMRFVLIAAALAGTLAATTAPLAAQRDTVLAHRWVGRHLGRPLFFEFYGDSMLVVNDRHVLDYHLTRDSLIAIGDTTVVGRYRIARGWLLFATPDGVVTMAKQSLAARPLTGRWIGPLGTADGTLVDLRIFANGVARWRTLPSGRWTVGEWDRTSRVITFTWETEETEDAEDAEGEEGEIRHKWRALYDPIANALLFEVTVPDAETTILRRRLR
jgi:hypothetical protein